MSYAQKAEEIADRLRQMGGLTPLSEAGKIYALLAIAETIGYAAAPQKVLTSLPLQGPAQ